ncbi:MAG: 2,3,4,5-tetrahydropyridine-2,6-dicarboxylate N-succinyltransferase [bacterium]|nr:2,3,4,5-tetrahydropyridine-2,6-dicarboxylate N-succinyltransferase [bacterium]
MIHPLQKTIEGLWEDRASLAPENHVAQVTVSEVLNALDSGTLRVCEKIDQEWTIHQWLKKAILLSFRLNKNKIPDCAPHAFDKVPLKFENWEDSDFERSGLRAIPGSIVRHGSFVGKDCVLMPSFINIGAFVDEGTMVDTWATVGSCAQVGKNCHISGGAGLGGVLEPLQANPVIIEDNCFIGARSEVVEGVIVEEGAVIGMGVFLSASTPIICRETGKKIFGHVPPYSVVISGTLPGKPLPDDSPGPHLPCAVIVKQVDARTRSKTSLNDLLRP